MTAGREQKSAAAAAADKVRAVLVAAEQSAAELRADAAREIDTQLAKAQAVAERLSARADEIERALQGVADSVRDDISALRADLEELRAVGEGLATARAEAEAETEAETEEAAAPPAEPAEEPPAEQPAAEQPTTEEPTIEEPSAEEAAPASAAGPAGQEGARVIALNMALNGSSREETAHYLSENFELEDPEALLDEVYARVSS